MWGAGGTGRAEGGRGAASPSRLIRERVGGVGGGDGASPDSCVPTTGLSPPRQVCDQDTLHGLPGALSHEQNGWPIASAQQCERPGPGEQAGSISLSTHLATVACVIHVRGVGRYWIHLCCQGSDLYGVPHMVSLDEYSPK